MTDKNTKTGISPTTLGRERNRYNEMSQIDGVTSEQVEAQKVIDAKMYAKKQSKAYDSDYLADYLSDIATLPKPANSGKRESDKRTRDALIVQTQGVCEVLNLATLYNRGEVKLTDEAKCIAFDSLSVKANILATNLNTSFDGIGALSMVHAPDGLFAVHISGWEDGSKNLRFQYAPRKIPNSKRSGYRDDSFNAPVYKILGKADRMLTPLPEPKAKGKGKGKRKS